MDILQYKCFIKAKMPRLIDKDGKIKSLDVTWADSGLRHTFFFERFAIDVLLATIIRQRVRNCFVVVLV